MEKQLYTLAAHDTVCSRITSVLGVTWYTIQGELQFVVLEQLISRPLQRRFFWIDPPTPSL